MKKRKVGIVIATLAVVGFGSLFFSQSSNWVMASVQEKLSSQKEIAATQDVDAVEKQAREEEEQKMLERELQRQLQLNNNLRLETVGTSYFLYCGQLVCVDDSLVEKDVAEENGTKVMDFIYENLNKEILMQYNMDNMKYTYSMQRNYEKPNDIIYKVSLINNDGILCNIDICLEDEPTMVAFSGNINADIYREHGFIAKEAIVGNEYGRRENNESLYNEYYNSSKNLIENVMGLPSINEKSRSAENAEQEMDVTVDEMQQIVTFGYQLEDGTYVKMSYNMINKTLERFEVVED